MKMRCGTWNDLGRDAMVVMGGVVCVCVAAVVVSFSVSLVGGS